MKKTIKIEHKLYQVHEPVVTDYAGNICINPKDKQGHMYVRASLVEVLPSR